MSSMRILGNDGTVVVWLGEKNVPESLGWLSVSTGFITDSEGCFSEVVQSIRLSNDPEKVGRRVEVSI